ncbi:uncharacterized protein LOC125649231 isoform X2 [Ostrea edulis]|uniref:uncharacterized protein LOC125649231 isoform X2 n=1 Tax=Ostrea edulis TaxID=37623 RepID=UPI0024AF777E|nr:uncharacterized protein LOC125649231 isoform X2 [Ostrea edulis]
MKLILVAFIQSLAIQCNCAPLPKWVYRVKSCPDPHDINKWKEASKRINCFHDLTSRDPKEQRTVYHCLPSTYFNESVEFCGRNVPIAPGNCPVYNYKYGQNTAPSYHNCGNFTTGCPSMMFHSKEVYKYPNCLKIYPTGRCFEADRYCHAISNPSKQGSTITTNEPKISSTSVPVITDLNVDNADPPEVVNRHNIEVITIVVVAAIVGLIFVLVAWKRNYLPWKKTTSGSTTILSEEEMTRLMEEQRNSTQGKEPATATEWQSVSENNGDVRNTEAAQRKQIINDQSKAAMNWKYNDLFESLKKDMTPKLVTRIKRRLRDRAENKPDELMEITEPLDLLDYLNTKYLAFHNIVFLQGIFLDSKAPKLYDQCLRYGKTRAEKIMFFEKRILETDHTRVVYLINCPNMSLYERSELETLRIMLSTLIHANYDDIIVSGVKNGCVVVTFMIRNCLIPSLRTLYLPSKRSMTCQWMLKLPLHYKTVKVMIEDDVIYMSDLLMSVKELTAEAALSGCVLRSDYPVSDDDKLQVHFGEKNVGMFSEGNCREDTEQLLGWTKDEKKLEDFLRELGGSITDDILQSMKYILHDFIEKEMVKVMDTNAILEHLSKNFKLQYNMCFLQWMFNKCGAHYISESCRKFVSENQFQLLCFHANATPCRGQQRLKFHIMVFELEDYEAEIHDLRNWLAKTLGVNPGEILMTALESGPIVVTFMMREKHAMAFLEFIKTDDGQIAVSRKRVGKIFQNGNLIKIGKALNGSNFVHVRLRFQDNGIKDNLRRGEKMVRDAVNHILRDTNLPMEGNEVYTKVVPSNQSENDNAAKRVHENWDSLLDELEPLTILNCLKFDEEFVQKVRSRNSRKERAECFLNKCCKLSEDEFEKVWSHLEKYCNSIPNEDKSDTELDPTKEWIKSNWDDVLDEIDSDFIDATIKNMKDVPSSVYTLWSDGKKSRKEKATIFLEFVLSKHGYLKALQKTLQEYNIHCPDSSEC